MADLSNDFRRYFDLESYVFTTVGPRFRELGWLDAFDFFCIVIWKANRAKSKVAKRMCDHHGSDLEAAVRALTVELSRAGAGSEQLRCLVKTWGFGLPMASAILTVFYPDEFTVYDVRVCTSLQSFETLGQLTNFEKLWDGYQRYISAVRAAGPEGMSLRDTDRWLWGKDFSRQLEADVASRFKHPEDQSGSS